MEPTLLADGALALVNASLYAYAGASLRRRRVSEPARVPWFLFSAWWVAIGAAVAIGGVLRLVAGAGVDAPWAHVAGLYLTIPLVCFALAALAHYLLFVLTGRDGLLRVLGAVYTALAVAIIYYASWSGPIGAETGAWSYRFAFERPPSGWPRALIAFAVVAPLVAAGLGFARLYSRVATPTQRFRIALVALAVLAWSLNVLLASEVGLAASGSAHLLGRLFGLLTATALILAYMPPAWVQRRLSVASLRDEAAGA